MTSQEKAAQIVDLIDSMIIAHTSDDHAAGRRYREAKEALIALLADDPSPRRPDPNVKPFKVNTG